ncbi:LEAF RUST 10 DISEASE-RESISTANCE LOCUS RECEPTOR-LIKE PROTEIN KINASE-like 1.2 isoform X2 [Musa acuminata AAA Group]|uniref:LEAF RUST 10 DISEASE-RESISTANCE LOCUS RECEPTOR-LIKE PROTEIN KINASE-like 1.2 isoform X2 n=1 Tax=Musa acuminata AAA Group TaxID=214697 RepID=UPI0031DCC07A
MPSQIRPPPSPPPLLPLPIPLLFLVLLFSIAAVSFASDYACQELSTSCGSVTNITYPFWLANDTDEHFTHCGYPDFKVICRDNTPILSLATDSYTVIYIDYDRRIISLADADILGSADTCPRVRHNLTSLTNFSLAYAPSDANLTFYFNCSDGLTEYMSPCLGKKSFVLTDEMIENNSFVPHNCEAVIVAPVLQEYLKSYQYELANRFREVLHEGFELNWSASTNTTCSHCEQSGGWCGLNKTSSTTSVFSCFCADGRTVSYNCSGKSKKSPMKHGVIIGIAASAGFFVLLCVGFIYYRHKKKQGNSPSSKSLVQNLSSMSSSKDPEKGSSAHFQTHLFSYEELEQATNHFDESEELGDGGFGTVYKGKLRDGRIVAVKRLYENNYRRVEQFRNEIDILSRLRHPNLVNLYGCTSRSERELLLVYEFVQNGTVADHLHGSRASEGILTWPVRLNIAVETADALAYLHAVNPPIIHRDVKTSNILLDSCFNVKVADFGLSRLFPTDVTHISTAPQGTPGYLDPEYHQCYQLTDKSDVYSFGVVLVELISSKPAVDITRHRKDINLANMAVDRIQNGELDQLVDEGLGYQSDEAIRKMITMVAEVAFRCLQKDGEMRPPVKEVLDTLKAIQSEGYKVAKEGKDGADNGDDAGLLKNIAPMSPDSVMNRWVSRYTTPNTSE